jgi:hypothetical protein
VAQGSLLSLTTPDVVQTKQGEDLTEDMC